MEGLRTGGLAAARLKKLTLYVVSPAVVCRYRNIKIQGRRVFFFFFLDEPVEFEFRLHTNEGIPAERAIAVTAALVRAIRSSSAFPEDGQIEIVEAGRGSFWAKLVFYSSLASAFAGVGSFATDIVDLLKQPDSELAKCVAWTMVEDGVTKAGIKCDGDYEVLKEQMPAVSRIVATRVRLFQQEEYGDANSSGDLEPDWSTTLDTAISEDRAERSPQSGDLPDHSTFVNIPPEPETVQLPGRFRKQADDLFFVQQNGQVGLLEESVESQELPLDVPVIARVSAVRGSHGGWADRQLRVVGWISADDNDSSRDPPLTRDIRQRGGDDEEFDLLPGQQSDDLRTISDPGHDLYDERTFIEQQPVTAFVGELLRKGEDVLIVTNNGDTFLLDGDVDYSDRETQRSFVVIGRAALQEDDLGRRRLLVNEVYPIHS